MTNGGLDLNGKRRGSGALDLEGCAAIGFGVCCLHTALCQHPGHPKKSEVLTSDVVLMHRYWELSVGVLVMQQGWVCGESSDGWLIAWDFCII